MAWTPVYGNTDTVLEWSWKAIPGVRAWVTSRNGGISAPPFDSLNLSVAVGDSESAVTDNWRRMLSRHGARIEQVTRVSQVHGNRVLWEEDLTPGVVGDGLLTKIRGRILSMLVADCVPIFLAASGSGLIGVLHAGWRGTVQNIGEQAIDLLREQGVDPQEIWVGVGPAIGPCCFQITAPVADALMQVVGDSSVIQPEGDGVHFRADLWAATTRLMRRAGVLATHIEVAQVCTACHPRDLFSYRRDHVPTGRMGAFIWRP